MHYNTEIAAKSIGITVPQGTPSQCDTICCCCGRTVRFGDPHYPLGIKGDSFMDDAWFVNRSQIVCPWCKAMLSSTVTKKLGSVNCIVYTRDGAYPIAKDENRAWFLITPPEPPFVVTASATINFQHVVWKTPVTLSPDMTYIGWPTRIMTIRHKLLMEAVEVCGRVSEEVTAIKTAGEGQKKKAKTVSKPITHPYISLDRNLTDLRHGMLRTDVVTIAKASQLVADGIKFLQQLTLGETWALSTLVKSKPEMPEQPEALTISKDVLLTSRKSHNT